jgi:hypothetical protein
VVVAAANGVVVAAPCWQRWRPGFVAAGNSDWQGAHERFSGGRPACIASAICRISARRDAQLGLAFRGRALGGKTLLLGLALLTQDQFLVMPAPGSRHALSQFRHELAGQELA